MSDHKAKAIAITEQAHRERRSRSGADLVKVRARVTDRGKGIGRIEWRVNGITAGVMSVAPEGGAEQDVERTLALDPGENQIEIIAYERLNLLASMPARATITFDGPADSVKPKLHILAIGINSYVDQGGRRPAARRRSRSHRSVSRCPTPRLLPPPSKKPVPGSTARSA